jgi:hypothetical protein
MPEWNGFLDMVPALSIDSDLYTARQIEKKLNHGLCFLESCDEFAYEQTDRDEVIRISTAFVMKERARGKKMEDDHDMDLA